MNNGLQDWKKYNCIRNINSQNLTQKLCPTFQSYLNSLLEAGLVSLLTLYCKFYIVLGI